MGQGKIRREKLLKQHSSGLASKKETSISLFKVAAYGTAALVFGWITWGFWGSQDEENSFNALITSQQTITPLVKTFPNDGREHISVGTPVMYRGSYPTSGNHYASWVNPGFKTELPITERLIHSLEHGMVVIYIDKPGESVVATLKQWVSMFPGKWSGLVVVPRPGIGSGVVLTAWRKKMHLREWDPSLAATFIDLYRGRGPEHPVR